ncbi:MAG: TonB-dependent receptor [Novosphingobium sp.]|nr:TonB-dependent receptor [Novosphingobium sp.]MBO9603600.1 TonB-dependent receptor [Novosphingobium sp.]
MSAIPTAASRRSLAVAVSTIALLAGTPVLAQDDAKTAAADNSDSNEIIVTAQFREQRLQDTPLAITAVNAETMEAKSQTNLAQVADSAPNVSLKPQGASFGPSIAVSIRGIGGADFNPAFEPGVGIYIDDVYYPQLTGAVFDLLDLDRVEILRGPQGTLSGRNSEGGSIKMFTRKPEGSNTGSLEATYGSRNRIGFRGSFDFKLTDDISGRISGVYKHQEGYVDRYDFGCLYPAGGGATFTANDGTTKEINPAGGIAATRPQGACLIDKLGEVGYQAVRGALRYNPSSDVDINLTGEYIHDAHTAAGEVLAATSLIDGVNTNQGTNAAQYAGGAPGVPYDNRFICGKFCTFSSYSSPAAVFQQFPFVPDNLPVGGQPLLATNNSDQSVYKAYNLAANIHLGLSDTFSLDNIVAYQNWKAQFGVDDDLSPIPLSGGYNSLTHWNWSEELRLSAKIGDTITAVIGGYYFKQQTNYYSYQDLRYVPVYPLQFIQPDQTPAEAKAVFANLSWEIAPNLTFDGGIRYTKESKEYHYFRLNPDGTINPYLDPVGYYYGAGYNGPDTLDVSPAGLGAFGPLGDGHTDDIVTALTGLVAKYKGSRWDWRGAINYKVTPDVMVYASVATGFKGGGANPRPFYASQAISFDPENLTNYELGFKSDLFDRRLRLNADVFYGQLKNLQIGVSVCPDGTTPCAALVNGGDAKEKGVEVEFSAQPVDGLSFDGSLSYLDFYYTKLNPNAGASLDDPLAGSPTWKWTLGGQYVADLGSTGTLTPRVDASYQSKVYTGSKFGGSPQYIAGYTVVNARLTWMNEGGDLSVSLEGTNLTNKYYYVSLFDLRDAGAGLDKAQPGRPREWAVSVKKKF